MLKAVAPYRPLLAVLAAAWPVWGWYQSRALHGSEDPVELLALVTAAVLFIRQGGPFAPLRPWQWIAASALLLLYAFTFAAVYPMVRAGLLVMILGVLVWNTRAALALSMLLCLSLPVSATLQFFLGYPLRLVVAEASRSILTGCGWPVVRVGTALHWAGETILVDAPCSGLKMLWAGCFFAAALACWRQLSAPRTVLLLAAGVPVLVGANIARATLLFFKESGLVALPSWTHPALGLVIFGGAALALLKASRRLTPATTTTA